MTTNPMLQLGQAATPQGQMQQMQQPLSGAQAQDPQSQYLMAALQAMQNQKQGSATGMGENLLADALDQYGLGQRRNALQSQAQLQGQLGQINSGNQPGLDQAWAGGMGGG